MPLARWRDARDCAAASTELALPLVDVAEARYPRWPAPPTGARRYRVRGDDGVIGLWLGPPGPLFADGARRYLVLLRSQRGALAAVRADLYPFTFAPDAAAAVHARVVGNDAG